jgi:mono/diheme cytochrome c family protein
MNRKQLWLAMFFGAAITLPAAIPASPVRSGDDVIAQDTSGKAIFAGKGICHVCHGPDAKGTPLAPNLTDAEWLNGDGSEKMLIATIKAGVASPKKHPAPMPPMGGAQLTDAEILSVARYILSLAPKPR